MLISSAIEPECQCQSAAIEWLLPPSVTITSSSQPLLSLLLAPASKLFSFGISDSNESKCVTECLTELLLDSPVNGKRCSNLMQSFCQHNIRASAAGGQQPRLRANLLLSLCCCECFTIDSISLCSSFSTRLLSSQKSLQVSLSVM